LAQANTNMAVLVLDLAAAGPGATVVGRHISARELVVGANSQDVVPVGLKMDRFVAIVVVVVAAAAVAVGTLGLPYQQTRHRARARSASMRVRPQHCLSCLWMIWN
jgi:hypothetical protein